MFQSTESMHLTMLVTELPPALYENIRFQIKMVKLLPIQNALLIGMEFKMIKIMKF